ncbi:MAG: hypothetical protein JXR91_09385 [Deltaproteobacteria bacterium]|nr:hypothetical protein [Deltaproteobacteria bacterium]
MKKLCNLKYLLLVSLLLPACSSSSGNDNNNDSDSDTTMVELRDTCLPDSFSDYNENIFKCEPLKTDYTPSDPDNDSWDACISDDNSYHKIEDSISSIARVEAGEAIGELLWNNSNVPSADDFIAAKVLLDTQEGLGSRIDRRYDIHYDPPSDGSSCDDEGVAEKNPDYCVGPAVLRPLLNEAFADGANGNNLAANAEIIHAAISWFFYVSTVKESTTCASAAKDCDSSWAYFTGAGDRGDEIGFAKEMRAIAPLTTDRAYDGILAVRCWRDLDSGETAENLDLQKQAITQYDTALLYGMSILIRQRFEALDNCTGDNLHAVYASLQVLVPLFDRAVRELDSSSADKLLGEIEKDPTEIDVKSSVEILDTLFVCP